MKKSNPRIFISYQHGGQEDLQWVRRFADALSEHGIVAWLDQRDLRPGDNVSDAVETALRSADMIVVLLRPESVQSRWVLFELGAAIGMDKKIAAILTEDVDPLQIPKPLRDRVYLVRSTPEETAQALASAVAA